MPSQATIKKKQKVASALNEWMAPVRKSTQPDQAQTGEVADPSDGQWPAVAYHADGRLMTREERTERAHKDRLFFGQCYFPHYFICPPGPFHLEWCREMEEMRPAGVPTSQRRGRRKAEADPRGSAKTTWWSQIDTIHGMVYEEEPYTMIIGSTLSTARQILRDIRVEFEDNELLREDFGNLVPAPGSKVDVNVRGTVKGNRLKTTVSRPMWAATSITTTTRMKVEAVAAGAALRGRRHGRWRPTKVVIDDLETDKAAQSLLQRDYLEKWVKSAVLKIGDSYTNYIYIDTLKHKDSVLNRILRGTGWLGRVRKAVIRWADNQKLWDEWRVIYTDKASYESDEARQAAALAFFEANREAMLGGTEVLWPEKPDRDYYSLMCLRVDDGEDSFNTEMQQEPAEREQQFFHPRFFDAPGALERDRIPWALWSPEFWENTDGYGSVDPSLGKKSTADFSPILFGAKAKKTGLVYVVIADLQRRPPSRIKADIFEHVRFFLRKGAPKSWLRAFGMESVQFQEYFAERTADDSAEAGLYLPVVKIEAIGAKDARIDTMQPHVDNGYYLFGKDQHEMVKQMTVYKVEEYHDDGPDALEMLHRVITGQYGTKKKLPKVASPLPIGIPTNRR